VLRVGTWTCESIATATPDRPVLRGHEVIELQLQVRLLVDPPVTTPTFTTHTVARDHLPVRATGPWLQPRAAAAHRGGATPPRRRSPAAPRKPARTPVSTREFFMRGS
jgi:hypothetical protein